MFMLWTAIFIVSMIAIPVGAIIAKRYIQSKLQESKRAPLKTYQVSENISVPELLHIVYKVREAKIISGKKCKEISHMITKEGATPETRDLVRQILYGRDDQVSSGELLGKEHISVGSKSDWAIVAVLIPLMIAVSFATADKPQPVQVEPSAREQHKKPSVPQKDIGDEIGAFIWSKTFVKDYLKAPSTADFPFFDRESTQLNDSTWVIKSYVDSQNSFGAIIRTRYIATMHYKGNDHWELLDIHFVDQ
ncbi:hypothetical protein L2W58_08240 [Dethiosulfovibrio sp. F2B]|uniref:hypothetical protein n=1 Tax=Dethiosulfovibrio faecalis TaxID=2720018 RepID=UPI001F46F8D3|nr:hypothetical protein [Dethiosulfovibrio faecalis]MCF4151791.1 hypothetical protein [Dethiosulfovibrio faecalis]